MLFCKQHFGVLRYVHFLALAYLAWAAVGPGGERFRQTGWLAAAIALVSGVGQQSLAVFVASMVMARGFGAVLDPWGGGALVTLAVNLGGIAAIIGVALLAAYFKLPLWSVPSQQASTTGKALVDSRPDRFPAMAAPAMATPAIVRTEVRP